MVESETSVTALILAGGRATRMGGTDKGLVPLAGKSMIEHVLDRISPQVDSLLINANRNIASYSALGPEVVQDTLEGFQGPLAGMLAGLDACNGPLLITAPCDSPTPPADYVTRMLQALDDSGASIAVAHDGKRLQPVFCLLKKELASSMRDFLLGGDRKIDLWFSQHPMVEVSFADQAEAFANVNNPDELVLQESLLKNK